VLTTSRERAEEPLSSVLPGDQPVEVVAVYETNMAGHGGWNRGWWSTALEVNLWELRGARIAARRATTRC
jgi:hypothetical protein